MAYYVLLVRKYYATKRVCNIPLLSKDVKFENSINIIYNQTFPSKATDHWSLKYISLYNYDIFKDADMQMMHIIYKNTWNIQTGVFVVILSRRNKLLYRFHSFKSL